MGVVLMTIPILATTPLAIKIAEMFHLTIIDSPTTPLLLYVKEERLELRDLTMGAIYVDFVGGALGYRRRYGGGGLLAKAIGLKHGKRPTVLDATAGLGRDAFILAYMGCHVQMVERSPVIAALLYNGLQRAQHEPDIGFLMNDRLQLIYDDAQHSLLSKQVDVVYLDPMYPHRNKSALVKKEMRILRAVAGDDLDAPALLKTALIYARHRVVVKRPKYAKHLDDNIPNFSLKSEKTRFDIYLK